VATAKALAEFKGTVGLSGLTTLDADTARALAGLKGGICLSPAMLAKFYQKNPPTPETALVWAELANGNFDALTTLDAATAKALSEYEGAVAHDFRNAGRAG